MLRTGNWKWDFDDIFFAVVGPEVEDAVVYSYEGLETERERRGEDQLTVLDFLEGHDSVSASSLGRDIEERFNIERNVANGKFCM